MMDLTEEQMSKIMDSLFVKLIYKHEKPSDELLDFLLDNTEFVSESDGQFTGGYYSELHEDDSVVLELDYNPEGVCETISVYDKEDFMKKRRLYD